MGASGGSTDGDLLLGLTGAARMLPYVAFSWATGRLADRFRRDRILRATLAARAVLLGVVAVAVARDLLTVAVLAASAAVAAGTPAYPALAAAMPRAAGAARRRATDLLVTVEVASFVVGPALGGLLLASWTRPALPLVAVLGTLAALLLVHGVRLPRPERTTRSARTGSVLRAARARGVPRAIATVALLNAVLAATGMALLPLAAEDWSGGYGLATAVLGFGAVAAPMLWRLGRLAGRAGPRRPGAAGRGAGRAAAQPGARVGAAVAGGRRRRGGARRGGGDRDAAGRRTRRAPGRDPRADRQRDGRRRPAGLAAGALAGHRARGPELLALLALLTAGCAAGAVRRVPETPRPPGPRIPQQRDGAAGRPTAVAQPTETVSRTGSGATSSAALSSRSMVVRSGTSRMKSTATRAITANGTAIRNM